MGINSKFAFRLIRLMAFTIFSTSFIWSLTFAQEFISGETVNLKCIKNPLNPLQREKIKIYTEPNTFSEILSEYYDFDAVVLEVTEDWIKIKADKPGVNGFVNKENISNFKPPIVERETPLNQKESKKKAESVKNSSKPTKNICEELILKMSIGEKLSPKEQKAMNNCF